ncbi:MAG: PDZ domain-containing protein, partial [Verrucomicrobiales bacterium]|nr:PDZ domain-containing protein [Verrucomicrobiales bacterium]
LKPVQWAAGETLVGHWVVTPGVSEIPQAIGIVSVPMRKIPPPRALIGVQLDHRSSAARIDRILPKLGAEKAGLKAGDLIVAVNGTPTNGGETLIKRLREFRDGQTVKLRVRREDQEFDASVELMIPRPEHSSREFDRADFMGRMGSELSRRAEDFELAIQHDSILQAWQCGGPLVNLEGKAIGLNIARAGRVASYALPADLVQHAVQKLKTLAPTQKRHSETLKTSHPIDAAR